MTSDRLSVLPATLRASRPAHGWERGTPVPLIESLKQHMMRHWSGALPAKIMSGPEARGPARTQFAGLYCSMKAMTSATGRTSAYFSAMS